MTFMKTSFKNYGGECVVMNANSDEAAGYPYTLILLKGISSYVLFFNKFLTLMLGKIIFL